jgi:hypothetical protein
MNFFRILPHSSTPASARQSRFGCDNPIRSGEQKARNWIEAKKVGMPAFELGSIFEPPRHRRRFLARFE